MYLINGLLIINNYLYIVDSFEDAVLEFLLLVSDQNKSDCFHFNSLQNESFIFAWPVVEVPRFYGGPEGHFHLTFLLSVRDSFTWTNLKVTSLVSVYFGW